MRVTSSTFTVAEYCEQMREKTITVNHDYQRSDKVWPTAARSYLIETLLLGFPMPKLSLYQTTDLKTKRTKKEIVDGQQRSQTIFDFLQGKLRLSGKGDFAGKTFPQLAEDEQQRFVDYALTVDIFVGATSTEIRQVFRRMNSYTVPLNPQEKRHAIHQGQFKWFIAEMAERYSESFKTLGVFGERQLSRMADAALLSDIAYTMSEGIKSASDRQLDRFYQDNEDTFLLADEMGERLTSAINRILSWNDIHGSTLMKMYNFYTLVLAISHAEKPLGPLGQVYERAKPLRIDPQYALPNLTLLSEALEEPANYSQFSEYVDSCAKATNRIDPRKTRFRWLSRALESKLLA
jgi:hypothetical protein